MNTLFWPCLIFLGDTEKYDFSWLTEVCCFQMRDRIDIAWPRNSLVKFSSWSWPTLSLCHWKYVGKTATKSSRLSHHYSPFPYFSCGGRSSRRQRRPTVMPTSCRRATTSPEWNTCRGFPPRSRGNPGRGPPAGV
jgi:hypothetical protein